MALTRGTEALDRLHALASDPKAMVAVEIDRDSRSRHAPRVIAVATPDASVIIDAAGTPGLGAALAEHDRAYAAVDAKHVHRSFLKSDATTLPSRWACAVITEQLLLGGREGGMEPDAIAIRHTGAPLPSGDTSLTALGDRARGIARLVAAQVPKLRENELVAVSKLEAAAVAPIAAMEHAGMPFDAPRWRSIDKGVREDLEGIRREVAPLLGSGNDLFGAVQVNLDSDVELKRALHAKGYKIENTRRETVLKFLPKPLGPLLARYRELTKLATAYGSAFLEFANDDGRVRPTFEQIGSSTGRMACHSPNLQSMVKDSPHRTCFHTREGRVLVTADYAACELRIIAELSGDPVFAEAFARGDDLHARVASAVFGKKVSKTENPELRQRAKAVNFGLAYGMGAQGLARNIEVHVDEARRILDRYFKSFPRIRSFLERSAADGLARGYARTIAGRRLYLTPDTPESRGSAERIAKNMPIQGTNADMTKIALARVHTDLRRFRNASLVNVVHDEIVVECDAADGPAVAEAVRVGMIAAGTQLLRAIPVEVDVAIGEIWGK